MVRIGDTLRNIGQRLQEEVALVREGFFPPKQPARRQASEAYRVHGDPNAPDDDALERRWHDSQDGKPQPD